MMPRKKRITMMIVTIVIVILIIITSVLLLYLNTDMFKSNQTLFTKYIGKNIENLETIENTLQETNNQEFLENNKYTENSEIKLNYTENIGTTIENTSNIINKLKLSIDGQTDKTNQYNYKNIKLLKDNSQVFNLEYIQKDNNYGVKFSDLFKQYVLVENSNLKNLFKKIGCTDDQINNIPDSIGIENNILEKLRFSQEEKEILKDRYLNIINQNVSKENFQKESNQKIIINQTNIVANAYTLGLTKEKMNDIYIKMLENLKQDEIILEKLETLQENLNYLNNVNNNEGKINVKEEFVTEIEKQIQEITKSNIGNDEIKITVYESEGKTVSTAIQGTDYEIYFDFLLTGDEKFAEIGTIENEEETRKYTLICSKDEVDLKIKEEKDENLKDITFSQTTKINDRNCIKNIVFKSENLDSRIEATITQNFNIVDSFKEEITLDDQNSIQLNQMEEEKLRQVINRIDEGLNEKIENLEQEINREEIKKVFKSIGILKEQEILNGTGVSESEKNRFNSKFELLKGEDISSENVVQAIETIKDNLSNMQAVSNQELKLEISRNEKNDELAETLKAFVEKDKNRKYNISIEYDENGLVRYFVLTIVEKQ